MERPYKGKEAIQQTLDKLLAHGDLNTAQYEALSAVNQSISNGYLIVEDTETVLHLVYRSGKFSVSIDCAKPPGAHITRA